MIKKSLARIGALGAAAALAAIATTGTAQASTGASYVGYGYTESGAGVWCVQHLLNDVARENGGPTVSEDSYWGQATYNQVRWFQQLVHNVDSSVGVDGVVGRQTGEQILEWGDQYYGGNGYCMSYVPSQTDKIVYPPTHLD
ncbi:peptidoglycan-binding protein [Streptomyces sp. NPDC050485]|uniref:peptidoglycan-binding protein n=1 Tax=Streptomyces sp. NPDC050485 TaxID=3365617 RepID=UPI00379B8F29